MTFIVLSSWDKRIMVFFSSFRRIFSSLLQKMYRWRESRVQLYLYPHQVHLDELRLPRLPDEEGRLFSRGLRDRRRSRSSNNRRKSHATRTQHSSLRRRYYTSHSSQCFCKWERNDSLARYPSSRHSVHGWYTFRNAMPDSSSQYLRVRLQSLTSWNSHLALAHRYVRTKKSQVLSSSVGTEKINLFHSKSRSTIQKVIFNSNR